MGKCTRLHLFFSVTEDLCSKILTKRQNFLTSVPFFQILLISLHIKSTLKLRILIVDKTTENVLCFLSRGNAHSAYLS